jgi:TfoX/Sxy family transcriptional regulator of competence genes
MAYDEGLAERIRDSLTSRRNIREQKMFGGIAFMLNNNMFAGVHGDELIVRLDGERAEAALKEKNTRQMVMGKMVAKGLVLVAPASVKTKAQLDAWLKRGTDFAESLPAKAPKKKAPPKKRTR